MLVRACTELGTRKNFKGIFFSHPVLLAHYEEIWEELKGEGGKKVESNFYRRAWTMFKDAGVGSGDEGGQREPVPPDCVAGGF